MRIGRLDGLRAIAVLLVILLHHAYARLGYVGVDLFFVLSGYLITGILRRSRDAEEFWGPFYLKRVTRILPPVLVLVTVAYLVTRTAKISSAVCYLFFLGPLDILTKNTIPVIQNLWSLAVEEHFYLVWPFAIRFLPQAKLKAILIAVVLIEPVLRLLAVAYLPNPGLLVYLLTPFRLDGLAMGSLLALYLEERHWELRIRKWSLLLSALAFSIYLGVCLGFQSLTQFSDNAVFCGFSYTVISVAMVGLVAHVLLNPDSILSRALALRPIVWLGTISYGIYLFDGLIEGVMAKVLHSPSYPIPIALRQKMLFYDLPLLIVISWLSFKYYEHPITLWGKRRADGNVRSETIAAKSTIAA